MKRAPALRHGDVVAVVAPGFAVRPRALRAGIAWLHAQGFEVEVGEHVLRRDGYLAGSDEQRAGDLNRALRDPRVRALWFARGGYGTARLLDRIDWQALERREPLLVGYSDATALFAALAPRARRICLYGPTVSELGDPGAFDAGSLLARLGGEPLRMRFGARQVLCAGRARGRLAGGNLTVLSHLMGTPRAPALRGRILLLEDVGEEAYRIDRMLEQLRSAGALAQLSGVLLGDFDAPPRKRFPPDRPLTRIFREFFEPLGVPVVRGLPFGHLAGKHTLPLGALASLDTRRGLLLSEP